MSDDPNGWATWSVDPAALPDDLPEPVRKSLLERPSYSETEPRGQRDDAYTEAADILPFTRDLAGKAPKPSLDALRADPNYGIPADERAARLDQYPPIGELQPYPSTEFRDRPATDQELARIVPAGTVTRGDLGLQPEWAEKLKSGPGGSYTDPGGNTLSFGTPANTETGISGTWRDPNVQRAAGAAAAAATGLGALLYPDQAEGAGPIRAYHGSPHDFAPEPGAPLGRFSDEKIGAGEGAQSYSYGHYSAEKEGVARGYRDQLSGAKATFDGIDVGSASASRGATEPLGEALWAVNTLLQKPSMPINSTADLITALKQESLQPIYGADEKDWWRQSAEQVQQHADRFKVTSSPGKMYELNINADPDAFLQWDKRYSEQPPQVRDALEKAGYKPPEWFVDTMGNSHLAAQNGSRRIMATISEDPQGGVLAEGQHFDNRDEAMRAMEERFGDYGSDIHNSLKRSRSDDPRVASILAGAGIPGVRYLDQGSRGVTIQHVPTDLNQPWRILNARGNIVGGAKTEQEAKAALDQAKTHNYVVFDPKTIEIIRKYGVPGLIGAGATAIAGQAHAVPVDYDPFAKTAGKIGPGPETAAEGAARLGLEYGLGTPQVEMAGRFANALRGGDLQAALLTGGALAAAAAPMVVGMRAPALGQASERMGLYGAGVTMRNLLRDETGAIRAWHASPYNFKKFDLSKFGSGEGEGAGETLISEAGHGVYSAPTEAGAREYYNAFVDEGRKPWMYEVNWNADPHELLDFNKPFSKQSPLVKKALRSSELVDPDLLRQNATGEEIYHDTGSGLGYFEGHELASGHLRELGIKGAINQYGDYVMFEPRDIGIERRYRPSAVIEPTQTTAPATAPMQPAQAIGELPWFVEKWAGDLLSGKTIGISGGIRNVSPAEMAAAKDKLSKWMAANPDHPGMSLLSDAGHLKGLLDIRGQSKPLAGNGFFDLVKKLLHDESGSGPNPFQPDRATDPEGRTIAAPIVAGQRTPGGPDVGLSPSEVERVATSLGAPPKYGELGGDQMLGLTEFDRPADRMRGDASITIRGDIPRDHEIFPGGMFDPGFMIHWDQPLDQQPLPVAKMLRLWGVLDKNWKPNPAWQGLVGGDLLKLLRQNEASSGETAKAMLDAGIQGVMAPNESSFFHPDSILAHETGHLLDFRAGHSETSLEPKMMGFQTPGATALYRGQEMPAVDISNPDRYPNSRLGSDLRDVNIAAAVTGFTQPGHIAEALKYMGATRAEKLVRSRPGDFEFRPYTGRELINPDLSHELAANYLENVGAPAGDAYSAEAVPLEHAAEAYKAYMLDPAGFKDRYPQTAAVIRQVVNDHPGLSRTIQFNEVVAALAGAGAAAALASQAEAAGHRLVPVDHDPFVEPAPAAGGRYTPPPLASGNNGMLQPGNIDLERRPRVPNGNGYSTVLSMGINVDGREVLIPRVAADGSRILSPQEAIEQFRRTGQHLGMFETPAQANSYAERLHDAQARFYGHRPAPQPYDTIEPPVRF